MIFYNIHRRQNRNNIIEIIDNSLFYLAKSIINILLGLYIFIIVIIFKYLILFLYQNI
jgi:hypothetical protein